MARFLAVGCFCASHKVGNTGAQAEGKLAGKLSRTRRARYESAASILLRNSTQRRAEEEEALAAVQYQIVEASETLPVSPHRHRSPCRSLCVRSSGPGCDCDCERSALMKYNKVNTIKM